MEVKGYLLRCARMVKSGSFLPKFIVLDAGENNADIKTELDRWLDSHPRLRNVRVVLPTPRSWIQARCHAGIVRLRRMFRPKEWRRDQAKDWAGTYFPGTQEKVASRIALLLAGHLGRALETVTPSTPLTEFMDNDLEPVKFILELEREFQTEISDGEGESFVTIGDVVACMSAKR